MTDTGDNTSRLLKSLDKARALGQEGQIIKAIGEYETTIQMANDVGDLKTAAMLCIEVGLLLNEPETSGITEDSEFNTQEKAITFYEKGLEYARKAQDPDIETDVHFNMAFSYINIKQFENALPHAQEALERYTKADNKDGISDAQYAIGLAYDGLDDVKNSVNAYTKALALYKAAENSEGVISVSMDLGRLYLREEDHEKAIKQFKLVAKTAQLLGDLGSEGDALNWLGEIYDELENTPLASKYYVESAEKYIDAKLFDLAKQNLDMVENGLMSLPKATRRRLRNKVWDLKTKIPKDLLSNGA